MSRSRCLALILLAAAMAVPGLAARILHVPLPPVPMALASGAAILGASFILLWACDAAQAEISQSLSLAIVALIAVLPEYAVDMYFTWQAGRNPAGSYAHYAVANMTGANRMLIGVAWAVIVAIFWFKTKRPVRIEKDRRLELFFLGIATVYAFFIPVKGTLTLIDGAFFLGLYAVYIVLAGRRPTDEVEAEGPAEVILNLPTAQRRLATVGLFLFAGGVILANAGPFCEGLIGTGKALHINEFLLVQWLAPIASEAPEFIVAISFALRRQAGLALGSLLAAKLNQWTLLVGMIPLVYAGAHGSIDHPIPMGSMQMHEILLTAAQSLLGVALLAMLQLSIWHALLLFLLFAGQFVAPGLIATMPHLFPAGLTGDRVHQVFSLLYLVSAFAVIADRPRRIVRLWSGLKDEIARPTEDALEMEAPPCCEPAPAWLPAGTEDATPDYDPGHGPNCHRCPYKHVHTHSEAALMR